VRYQRRRLARALSFPQPSLPQGGPLVLGADLKCSEWWFSFISKGFYSLGFKAMLAFL
jgi:hypothetical protein